MVIVVIRGKSKKLIDKQCLRHKYVSFSLNFMFGCTGRHPCEQQKEICTLNHTIMEVEMVVGPVKEIFIS